MGDRGVCVISGFASFLGSVVSCWRLPCFALPCVCGGSRSLFAVVFRGGHLAPCGSRGVLRGCLIVLLFLSPRPPSFSFATGVFGLSAWGAPSVRAECHFRSYMASYSFLCLALGGFLSSRGFGAGCFVFCYFHCLFAHLRFFATLVQGVKLPAKDPGDCTFWRHQFQRCLTKRGEH